MPDVLAIFLCMGGSVILFGASRVALQYQARRTVPMVDSIGKDVGVHSPAVVAGKPRTDEFV